MRSSRELQGALYDSQRRLSRMATTRKSSKGKTARKTVKKSTKSRSGAKKSHKAKSRIKKSVRKHK